MSFSYDIINYNIELHKKVKELLGDKFEISETDDIHQHKSFANYKLRFADGLVLGEIDFRSLKAELIRRCYCNDTAKRLAKLTPKSFNTMLLSESRFNAINGGLKIRGKTSSYNANFYSSSNLIMNWVIQNNLDAPWMSYHTFSRFYTTKLPIITDYALQLETEKENLLQEIKNTVLSQSTDLLNLDIPHLVSGLRTFLEQIKKAADIKKVRCIIEENGIILNNTYDVVGINPIANTVVVTNENGTNVGYKTSRFAPIDRMRKSILTKLLEP